MGHPTRIVIYTNSFWLIWLSFLDTHVRTENVLRVSIPQYKHTQLVVLGQINRPPDLSAFSSPLFMTAQCYSDKKVS